MTEPSPDGAVTGRSSPESPLITSPTNRFTSASNRCGFPAPLVVNGGVFVGCSRESNHDGQHKVEVSWGDWRDQTGDAGAFSVAIAGVGP